MTPFERFHLLLKDLEYLGVVEHLGPAAKAALNDLCESTDTISAIHGDLGPDENWNRPLRNSGAALGSSPPSNRSRTATPVRDQDRLHPNFPITPPSSRPGSLNGLNRIKELEAKITQLKDKILGRDEQIQDLQRAHDRLTQKLDDYKEDIKKAKEEQNDHASANEKILELEDQVSGYLAALEPVRKLAASSLSQLGNYSSAGKQYQQLCRLKRDEQDLKARQNDERGRKQAAVEEINYAFLRGKVLADGNREDWPNAEQAFKEVLQLLHNRRSGSGASPTIDTRDVKARLCEVLRRQDKLAEAKDIYLDGAISLQLDRLDTSNRQSCAWALQNGMSLAHLLIKERRYPDGMYWLEKVWQNRHTATPDGLGGLEEKVMQIVMIMDSRGDSDDLFKLLAMVCSGNNGAVLSNSLLQCYASLGLLYHFRPTAQQPKELAREDHTQAVIYLHQAWAERRQRDTRRISFHRIGWALAGSMIYLRSYEEARDILQELYAMETDEDTHQGASEDCILALLAHTQLMLKDYHAAETTAADIFQRSTVKDVFATLRSTPNSVNFSKFHHADTLIRACTLQKALGKFTIARNVWSAIYKAREGILGVDKAGILQLTEHRESARLLESEWREFAKKTKAKPAVKVPAGFGSEIETVKMMLKR